MQSGVPSKKAHGGAAALSLFRASIAFSDGHGFRAFRRGFVGQMQSAELLLLHTALGCFLECAVTAWPLWRARAS